MSVPFSRPPARSAGPELLVLQKWEEFTGWLLDHTSKWPKSARFGLVRRVDDHALDVTEMLIVARYEPGERRTVLREANLRLERLRFLLRIARAKNVCAAKGFETAMRGIDECGRMIHGWRVALGDRRSSEPERGGLATEEAGFAPVGPEHGEEMREGELAAGRPAVGGR
jgi:hypothetical protein